MKKVTLILVGAGTRGINAYAPYALEYPNEFEFVAVAEPNEERRNLFGDLHKIPLENRYESWEQLLSKPKMADAIMVCTMDTLHYEPAKAGMERGYHVFVEKPMSPYLEENFRMAELTDLYPNQIFMIGHVLRYTNFFSTVKKLLTENRIGRTIGIQLVENVEYWHMAHSYVRGSWRNTATAASMLLSKSCHDLDILVWLAESECEKVSSFGSLQYFQKENAPEGSALRCVDCNVETQCPYSAQKIYIGTNAMHPSIKTDPENVENFLHNSPYSRCVFHCDNNVVDHQVVNMVFKNGIIADFLMGCFTLRGQGRTIKIMGTHGEINGVMGENAVTVHNFVNRTKETVYLSSTAHGHGGGDEGLIRNFAKLIRENRTDALASGKNSLESHIIGFAAEEARLTDRVIQLDEYKKEYGMISRS